MKKILSFAFSAVLLLAGCAKEVVNPVGIEGGLQEVTFTAAMSGDVATKAVADNDGNGAYVNRCIMEVYYGDSLFTRMYSVVENSQASFTAQLVANRTYKVAFWADYVESTTEPGLQVDKYYDTRTSGLKAVALKGTYSGNVDARDAFAFSGEYTVAQAGGNFTAVLHRPFAQINVITTDVATVAKIASLKPDEVELTINNAVTSYNVLDSTAVENATGNLTYNADVYNWKADTAACTLSMDYLFAENSKQLIDIEWAAKKSMESNVEHSFANIPYQRNYRTNIKGALLTTQGQWNVTVDPVWASDTAGVHEVVVVAATVDDIDGMNTFVAGHPEAHQYDVTFSQQPNDAGTPGVDDGAHAVLTTPLGTGDVLNVAVETNTETLYVGDYVNQSSTTLTTEVTNAATVNINVPSGKKIETLVINAPSKSVYLNGALVASVGTLTNVEATTSANTLVIEANQSITGKLTVHQGGLEIHGSVAALGIRENDHENHPVKVRACENLSQAVFDTIYVAGDHDYIDRPAYVQKANGTDPETWDIVKSVCITGTVAEPIGGYLTLEEAFAAVTANGTVTLLEDVTTSTEILVDKKVTLNLNGHSINSGTHSVFQVNGGNLNISGEGTISGDPSNYKEIWLKGSTDASASNYSVLAVGDSVKVSCSTGYAIMVSQNEGVAYGTMITVRGEVEGYYGALYVNGTIQATTGNVPNIYVYGKLKTNEESTALYAAGYAKYYIMATASLTGNNAAYISSGAVTIYGGTFTATGAASEYVAAPSGYNTTGDAIVIDTRDGYAAHSVSITGGKFYSENNEAIAVYPEGAADKAFISGGYFSTAPADSLVADTYGVIDNVDNATKDTYPYTIAQDKLVGSGTEADPYQVASAKDLNIMGSMLKLIPTTKQHFKLTSDVVAGQSDNVEYSDAWGDTQNAVVPYLNNAEFDGNGKTITMDNVNEAHVFGDVKGSTITNLTIDFQSGNDADVVYYANTDVVFNNVVTKGDMVWNSGNFGIFCSYFRVPLTMTDCVNKADIQTVSGDETMYCGVFTGYGMGEGDITMTNCSNEGSLAAGRAGMFVANGSYSFRGNFVITNCKNNGTIRSIFVNDEYNYCSAWVGIGDKSHTKSFNIDGVQYTDQTEPKWYSIDAQGGVVGTGSFTLGPNDASLALNKNNDGTFTITPSTANAAYYVVSVGLYVGTNKGSCRNYATQKVYSGTTITELKYLSFVDYTWVANNPSAVQSQIAGNTVYTLGDNTYYLVSNEGFYTENHGPEAPQMISVSAFDAEDKLLASAPLTE